MIKTIKLYHGTSSKYDRIDLGMLSGFSEGAGIYMTSSPSYAITYTSLKVQNGLNSLNFKIGKKTNNYDIKVKDVPSIHEVEVPLNLISDENTKRIPIIDFYNIAKELDISIDLLKNVHFTGSDFSIFNSIITTFNLMYDVKQYKEDKTKFYQIMFDFMVEHDYHVIKVPQPTRNMVKVFYLMLDVNLFNKGKVYTLNEIK